MMKSMIRKQDGYVLAYVLVVVMVVSLIAVVACTTAVRNHDAQLEAVDYTREKYVAEGGVELFAAELQAGAARCVSDFGTNRVSEDDLNNAVANIIGLDDANLADDSNDATGVYKVIRENPKYKGSEYTVIVVNGPTGEKDNYTPMLKYIGVEGASPAYAYYEIVIDSYYGSVKVSADIELSFVVKDIGSGDSGDKKAVVDGVLTEFTSYRVSTVSDSEVDE